MSVTIIITFCVLLLIAYVFDLTAAKTKIPSVILLLLLGWSMRQLTILLHVSLPDFSPFLPVMGTVGLILIVLEGSLELELNASKLGIIRKSFFGGLFSMLALAAVLAIAFSYVGGTGLKESLTNAIPLCVISSAVAIPSVKNLSAPGKEFVIYESSFSDILGVLIFNFLALNSNIDASSFFHFAIQLVLIGIVSFIATVGLSLLLNSIEHHTKYVPIILMVILIYAIAKVFHLPGLVFIMLFGISIGNIKELRQLKWVEKFKPDQLAREVIKFREVTTEGAFLVRSVFFLLFGYLIDTNDALNADTFQWAAGIVCLILLFRAVQLKVSDMPLLPLLFIAPRGLITILLFLSVDQAQRIPLVNNSLIIQIIILMALIMMAGMVTHKTHNK